MSQPQSKHPVWGGSIAPDKCEVCRERRAMLAVLPRYPALESERVYYLCVQCLHQHVLMAIAQDMSGADEQDIEAVAVDVHVNRRRHRGIAGRGPSGKLN